MTRTSVTDRLHESRLTVVAVDHVAGRVRLKASSEVCTELACGPKAEVVTDDANGGLERLCPGDIVRVESRTGAPDRIVVVRRAWDELSSPEF